MDEANRVAMLERENSELKAEREALYAAVDQMRKSINRLIERYITENDC